MQTFVVCIFIKVDIMERVNTLNYGAVMLVVTMIAGYFNTSREAIVEKEKNSILAKIAYNDLLTDMYNRAKYESVLDELNIEHNISIIFYDLNGLKTINDTRGYKYGDILIKKFSEILRESTINTKITFRIGGDEFVTISDNVSSEDVSIFIDNVSLNIEENNKYKMNSTISVSYGLASSIKDTGLTIKELVKLADDGMYIMKKKIHTEKIGSLASYFLKNSIMFFASVLFIPLMFKSISSSAFLILSIDFNSSIRICLFFGPIPGISSSTLLSISFVRRSE